MKRQLATEWLIEQIEQSLLTVGYSGTKNKLRVLKKQAKQKELDNLDKSYAHGSLSLLDTGHGDTFEQYIKETYEIDNKK